jgi:hypothetical protein
MKNWQAKARRADEKSTFDRFLVEFWAKRDPFHISVVVWWYIIDQ